MPDTVLARADEVVHSDTLVMDETCPPIDGQAAAATRRLTF